MLIRRGLTNRRLAAMIGVGETHVSRWRNGHKPGALARRLIARELEMSPEEIAALGWDPDDV